METSPKKHDNPIFKDSFAELPLKNEAVAWPWLARIRQGSYERFKLIGFPTRELEAWKTISLDPLLGASFVSSERRSVPELGPGLLKNFHFSEKDSRIVFVNGFYSDELSSAGFLPHGVFLGRRSENSELTPDLVSPYLARDFQNDTNAFSLINAFSFKEGAFITVPKDTQLDKPLQIFFITSNPGENGLAIHPRVLIVLGDRSKAEVIVHFAGFSGDKYFNNACAEIYLGEGASLDCGTVQRESKSAVGFLSSRYFLKKKSSLNGLSFSQGGRLLRNEVQVRFDGAQASASLKGLSMLSGESQAFHHVTADHAAPHCVSRQFYKNILADRSKSEFNSLVHVGCDAQKSDSNQLNKNLLLSDLAQCYSRPQLKIDNDDVSCTHGATVGQLEKDELFYLRSRGFSEALARFVLTYGFAEEILQEIKPEALKKELESLVSEELKRVIQ